MLDLHTPAAHSLLLQACSGCSMGTGFAQHSTLSVGDNDTAVPGCPGTLRMLYVGARSCCTPHARLQQAAASLCSLVCDCYRVLTTAHRVVRAELTSTTLHTRCREVWARCTYLTLCHGNHARLLPASAGFSTCTALLMLAH
jgi:hypothetical protein